MQGNKLVSTHWRDLTSVDWYCQKAENSIVDRNIFEANKKMGWQGNLKNLSDSLQIWMSLTAMAIATACTASAIRNCSRWLSSLKYGYCLRSFLLDEATCCLGDDSDSLDSCPSWLSWSSLVIPVLGSVADFAGDSSLAVDVLTYVIIGTLMAVLGAYLVQVYAPYAIGSGLPEVKTILGGFIIRRFLGLQTLIIKGVDLAFLRTVTINKSL